MVPSLWHSAGTTDRIELWPSRASLNFLSDFLIACSLPERALTERGLTFPLRSYTRGGTYFDSRGNSIRRASRSKDRAHLFADEKLPSPHLISGCQTTKCRDRISGIAMFHAHLRGHLIRSCVRVNRNVSVNDDRDGCNCCCMKDRDNLGEITIVMIKVERIVRRVRLLGSRQCCTLNVLFRKRFGKLWI